MARVSVRLSERSYEIEISGGVLAQAGAIIASRMRVSHAVVITDRNVDNPYAQAVEASLRAAGARTDRLVVEAGEPSKSVASADSLWNALLAAGADRKTVVVAVGGGVVGD